MEKNEGMELRHDQIGMCGAYCDACDWKEKTGCPGCQVAKGQMFYGTCGCAKCAVEKKLHHCGQCEAVPCSGLQEAFDHPEHGDNGERLINLKNWANGNWTYTPLTPKKSK